MKLALLLLALGLRLETRAYAEVDTAEDSAHATLGMRTGEAKQGVIGLFQTGLPGEQSPGLSVRFMGIDQRALASYLIALYCSAAVLTTDAIALLDDVDVGQYHEYK